MTRYRKTDIAFREGHPAVPFDTDGAWWGDGVDALHKGGEDGEGNRIDPRFTVAWVERNVSYEAISDALRDGFEAAWEHLEEDAKELFGSGVKVYGDGHGYAYVGSVTVDDVVGWDAPAVARWAKFEKWAGQQAADVPYLTAWALYHHHFLPAVPPAAQLPLPGFAEAAQMLVLPDRFWAKVDKAGPVPAHRPDLGPCWLWTAAKYPNGYGHFNWRKDGQRRDVLPHREAYEALVGPVPKGIDLDHLCRVRHCCNPAHLEPTTRRENLKRGVKGALTTHCPRGHPYDETNTVWRTTPTRAPFRDCRACVPMRARELQERRRNQRDVL